MTIHTYPVAATREHVTTGLDCWCGPTFFVPCDECDDGCWKCTDGLVPLSRGDAEFSGGGLVIVHREVLHG